jgi:alkanesulfonate monooxygenase SsuD/methylene tetrahydromethanopterin reductase-like flavin-dependent oxidoreductase (luciferase family)
MAHPEEGTGRVANGAGLKIGIGLPRVAGIRGDLALDWARRADAGPFSTLAVTDRVVQDVHEPLIALASAIGVTSRIRLLTSVVIGPTRETTLLARQAASIDVLSGGRLTLGLGVGVREDDYAATGFPFQERGRRLDEQLPILRRLWAGRALNARVGAIGPLPVRLGGPEVLIGGYVSAIVDRITAWGDGYMSPGGGEPERMRDLWQRIIEAWDTTGRKGRPRWVSSAYFALGPGADEAARSHVSAYYAFNPELAARRIRGIATTPERVEAAIELQASMGVDEFILRPCAADIDSLERLAEIVERIRRPG